MASRKKLPLLVRDRLVWLLLLKRTPFRRRQAQIRDNKIVRSFVQLPSLVFSAVVARVIKRILVLPTARFIFSRLFFLFFYLSVDLEGVGMSDAFTAPDSEFGLHVCLSACSRNILARLQ